MRFVHHQACPLDGPEDGLVDGDELVGGEEDVELDLCFFLEETESQGEDQVMRELGRIIIPQCMVQNIPLSATGAPYEMDQRAGG